jgi:hypothetical protein
MLSSGDSPGNPCPQAALPRLHAHNSTERTIRCTSPGQIAAAEWLFSSEHWLWRFPRG